MCVPVPPELDERSYRSGWDHGYRASDDLWSAHVQGNFLQGVVLGIFIGACAGLLIASMVL